MLSSLLAGTSLPLERVTAQKFRAGQIISDRPSGVLSVGLIVSGRVEVYSVALDGKDVQLNTLTVGSVSASAICWPTLRWRRFCGAGRRQKSCISQKTVLLSCMEQDAGLAMRYAALCNRKIQFLLRRIELLTMQSCRGRLIAHLLEQQDEVGVVKITGLPGGSGPPSGGQPGRPLPRTVCTPIYGNGFSGWELHHS